MVQCSEPLPIYPVAFQSRQRGPVCNTAHCSLSLPSHTRVRGFLCFLCYFLCRLLFLFVWTLDFLIGSDDIKRITKFLFLNMFLATFLGDRIVLLKLSCCVSSILSLCASFSFGIWQFSLPYYGECPISHVCTLPSSSTAVLINAIRLWSCFFLYTNQSGNRVQGEIPWSTMFLTSSISASDHWLYTL